MNVPKKWRDAPLVFLPSADRDRYLRRLFLMCLEREVPCGPAFWTATTAEAWAADWLPGVPWGDEVARELWRDAIELREAGVIKPGAQPHALPIVSLGGTGCWGEPREPLPRATERPEAFAVRWRRFEAAERKRLQAVPGLVAAKPIDPDHLRWLARRLHGATYRQIALQQAGAVDLDDAARVVARAVKAAATRLAIPPTALQKQSR